MSVALDQITRRKYTTSKKGVDFIKSREGWSATPYKDVAGYLTIGYGHLITDGESFTRIDRIQGETLLRQDLKRFENAVNNNVTVPITQGMYDALVSFSYNVGVQAFIDSTLLKKLNAGDYSGASAELERWKYAGGEVVAGLVNRREKELQLFWS